MNAKLTPEQREALKKCAGQPVRIADEASSEVFYLVSEEAFAQLRSFQADCDEEFKQKLRNLITDGIQSPEMSAEQVFSDLRAEARKLTGNQT